MPSTADTFNGGEDPESHKDFRVNRITADATFDGSNFWRRPVSSRAIPQKPKRL
jgi:hypothetical protein